ncbi:MAG: CCA tRNA nucleotidyltransferase [Paracoccus sp. (in: a-proteobacteria)]|nr:CCA tRNA nucleotidyltransferase [Paracoccus sp. (in: a-proteobacteria)]
MKIDAAFLNDPALIRVLAMLEAGGYRALIVGGAIRDAVLGMPVGDIDLATDALPDRVVELARDAGLKSVPTGIAHGTVTVISEGTPFEITTFRRDVETDGRNATVAFSDRIEDDAARRDFTLNALYATPSGKVLDPVGGWPDLRRRILRFVGEPDQRMAEDYLRILRFFRFLACYPLTPADGMQGAIRARKSGLARISAERIGAEMRKLLAAPDPGPALDLMRETGVLDEIFGETPESPMKALIAAEKAHDAPADWLRRLALIAPADAPARLRLSRAETARLDAITRAETLPPAEAAFRHGAPAAFSAALIGLARGRALPADWPARITRAANAPLPVTAADLMPDLAGPALGRGLKAAEGAWIASGFSATRGALIEAAKEGVNH